MMIARERFTGGVQGAVKADLSGKGGYQTSCFVSLMWQYRHQILFDGKFRSAKLKLHDVELSLQFRVSDVISSSIQCKMVSAH